MHDDYAKRGKCLLRLNAYLPTFNERKTFLFHMQQVKVCVVFNWYNENVTSQIFLKFKKKQTGILPREKWNF